MAGVKSPEKRAENREELAVGREERVRSGEDISPPTQGRVAAMDG